MTAPRGLTLTPDRRSRLHRLRLSLSLIVLAGALSPTLVSGQAPDETWRRLDTTHFRVTYPAELRWLATRVAERAERAHRKLHPRFDDIPASRIDIVVSDHTDAANGFASVIPWNRIVILAPVPTSGFELAYFDDWLELVVTHELVHILHLDRRGPLGTIVKTMFGRSPVRWPTFPNSALPRWVIEGLATYYESALTDAGRVQGTFQDMALRTAVLEDEFETLYQVSGETQVWPAGNRPYIYGASFLDHLARHYGEPQLTAFVDAVDQQLIPFRMNTAAKRALGVSFDDAFAAWSNRLNTRYATQLADLESFAPVTAAESIADGGRWALYPKVSPDGHQVAFARSDGSSDPQIHLTNLDGARPVTLTRSNDVSRFDWTPDGRIVFSQTDFVDRYRILRDLYLAHPSGRVRRITNGARLDYPTVSPDGEVVLAVQQSGGQSWLSQVELSTGRVTPLGHAATQPHEAQWSYPAWSPDGRWIAVSRWTPGAHHDLVILNGVGQLVDEVTTDRALDLAPTWTPDGRSVLWASDRTGIPNLFAASIDAHGQAGPIRQVTNLQTGGAYPDVDPSGSWIYFSEYHADGWHVVRIPHAPATWRSPAPIEPRFLDGGQEARETYTERIDTPEHPYRPFPSLWPRYWVPTVASGQTHRGTRVLGPSIGLSTTAIDTVERHAIGAAISYEPQGQRVRGDVAYGFYGLGNPILSVTAAQRYTSAGFLVTEPTSDDTTSQPRGLFLVEREREVGVEVSLLRQRVRHQASVSVGSSYVWQRQELLNDRLRPDIEFRSRRPDRGLPQISASASFDTSRRLPFSISRENGVSGFVRARRRWDQAVPKGLAGISGADGTFTDLVGELRLYRSLPTTGFARQTVALRVSGGIAEGSGAVPSFYAIGGNSGLGDTITGLRLFTESSFQFPVRGYPWGIRSGITAWSATAEYRLPLARVNRGLGAFPFYIDWVSANLFVDAGNAWGQVQDDQRFLNPRRKALSSVGGELVFNTLPLWTLPTLLRTGLAFPLVEETGVTFYVRFGVPF